VSHLYVIFSLPLFLFPSFPLVCFTHSLVFYLPSSLTFLSLHLYSFTLCLFSVPTNQLSSSHFIPLSPTLCHDSPLFLSTLPYSHTLSRFLSLYLCLSLLFFSCCFVWPTACSIHCNFKWITKKIVTRISC